MTRDARLYLIEHQDWKLLVDKIEQHKNHLLKELVVIYELSPSHVVQHYAVLSMSDDVDKILEDYGAKEAEEKDLLRNTLHTYYAEPLYGDKSKVVFLNKVR